MGKGRLVFKGDKQAQKKKKRKVKHRTSAGITGEEKYDGEILTTTTAAAAVETSERSTIPTKAKSSHQQPQMPTIKIGEGKITSSGTVLMGFDTNFSSTLHSGDAIIVMVPASSSSSSNECIEEMRVITMSLSNNSAAVSSAFSHDLKTPTGFQYISKPRNVTKERLDRERRQNSEKEETERCAFGIYKSTEGPGQQEVIYRERTEHGSYRYRRELIRGGDRVDRTDLLNMRAKKKADKYC